VLSCGLEWVVTSGGDLHNALVARITRGFLTAAGIALAALVIAVIAIRIRREDLADAAAAAERQPAK